jgi:hypothetical protein
LKIFSYSHFVLYHFAASFCVDFAALFRVDFFPLFRVDFAPLFRVDFAPLFCDDCELPFLISRSLSSERMSYVSDETEHKLPSEDMLVVSAPPANACTRARESSWKYLTS